MKTKNQRCSKLKTKVFLLALIMLTMVHVTFAQNNQTSLAAVVSKLEQAETPADYQALEQQFLQTAPKAKKPWLAYYYAAFCNAKTGFLYQKDGAKIEPFTDKGEDEIKVALSLIDTASQKAELAEVYVVMSMIYQAAVYINPMSYGPEYGPKVQRYLQQAAVLAPDNPRVLYMQAWEKYYTPKTWGGDKQKARELAKKALQKLQEEPQGYLPHWGKKECEALLAKYK